MICPTCGQPMERFELLYNVEAWKCSGLTHPFNEPLTLEQAVRLDCQPKSKDDAVYVSLKWRDRILKIANGGTAYAD